MREVATEEEAVAERFPGSRTIRVDGADLFPSDEPPSLRCRIYRLADGRFSPTRMPGCCARRSRGGALATPEVGSGRVRPWRRCGIGCLRWSS